MPIILEEIQGDYLTTLARVKEYLNITVTTYDDKLTNLLSSASENIQRICNTEFISESRTELHNGGQSYLELAAAPITSSVKVSVLVAGLGVGNSSSSTYEALAKVDSGVLTLTRNGTDSTLTLSSYATITALVAAINALGSGWTATAEGDYASYPASRIQNGNGVYDVSGWTAYFGLFVPLSAQQTPNNTTGTVFFDRQLPCGHQNVQSIYVGGFTTIPDDLQTACCDLVAALYRLSTRDATLKREKLGSYEYENFSDGSSMRVESLAPDAAELLKPYRRVRAL